MKSLLFCAAFALATGPALADTCKTTAESRKLSSPALASFMKRCEMASEAACDSQADEKKLVGAAKTSFTTKCVRDAVGQ
jgi:hypothetical protein